MSDRRPVRLMRRGAELFCAALFAALFGVFVLQIVFRYVLGDPLPWTQEICTLLYVWIVCLGAASIVREREHVTFDLVYILAAPRARRVLALLGTGFVALVLLAALPGNLDYLAFMQTQPTPTLRLPMSIVIAPFSVFLVLAVVQGVLRIRRLLRPGWEAEP